MSQESRACGECGYPLTLLDPHGEVQFVATAATGSNPSHARAITHCPRCGVRLTLMSTSRTDVAA